MRFQLFRQIILGIVIAISMTSIVVCLKFLPPMHLEKTFYLAVIVQGAYIARSLYSIIRKPLLRTPHGVGSELIGLFVLLPFEAMLALIVSTGALEKENTETIPVPVVALVLSGTLLNLGYTVCILIAAVLTAAFFDFDIWLRDIDSSPCPFPGPVLLSWLRGKWVNRGKSADGGPALLQHPYCLPGCNCRSKLLGSDLVEASEAESPRHASALTSQEQLVKDMARPQSLIRIPNATEQRNVIPVAFEAA